MVRPVPLSPAVPSGHSRPSQSRSCPVTFPKVTRACSPCPRDPRPPLLTHGPVRPPWPWPRSACHLSPSISPLHQIREEDKSPPPSSPPPLFSVIPGGFIKQLVRETEKESKEARRRKEVGLASPEPEVSAHREGQWPFNLIR